MTIQAQFKHQYMREIFNF